MGRVRLMITMLMTVAMITMIANDDGGDEDYDGDGDD